MDDRACEYCGKPLSPDARSNQRYCGRTHKRQARRQAQRREEIQERLVTMAPPYADMSLTELDARRREARAAQDPGDLREFSDHGELPGDLDDEHGARFHQMIEADAARRIPRQPWAALKRMYSANPGVELPSITSERTDRYKAEQAAIKARLRAAPGQVEDRHNAHTRDVVRTRAAEARRLNKHYATADPRPVTQRPEFSFEAEQVQGSFYRGGRARGQQSRHSDYQWRMDDGFRY